MTISEKTDTTSSQDMPSEAPDESAGDCGNGDSGAAKVEGTDIPRAAGQVGDRDSSGGDHSVALLPDDASAQRGSADYHDEGVEEKEEEEEEEMTEERVAFLVLHVPL